MATGDDQEYADWFASELAYEPMADKLNNCE